MPILHLRPYGKYSFHVLTLTSFEGPDPVCMLTSFLWHNDSSEVNTKHSSQCQLNSRPQTLEKERVVSPPTFWIMAQWPEHLPRKLKYVGPSSTLYSTMQKKLLTTVVETGPEWRHAPLVVGGHIYRVNLDQVWSVLDSSEPAVHVSTGGSFFSCIDSRFTSSVNPTDFHYIYFFLKMYFLHN